MQRINMRNKENDARKLQIKNPHKIEGNPTFDVIKNVSGTMHKCGVTTHFG